jgi:hypothetical protein
VVRLQFQTSFGAFIEGRIIDVETPLGPELTEWLERGIVKALPDEGDSVALAQAQSEKAVRPSPRRSSKGHP